MVHPKRLNVYSQVTSNPHYKRCRRAIYVSYYETRITVADHLKQNICRQIKVVKQLAHPSTYAQETENDSMK